MRNPQGNEQNLPHTKSRVKDGNKVKVQSFIEGGNSLGLSLAFRHCTTRDPQNRAQGDQVADCDANVKTTRDCVPGTLRFILPFDGEDERSWGHNVVNGASDPRATSAQPVDGWSDSWGIHVWGDVQIRGGRSQGN
jgi:hypothetical protein